MEKNNKIILLGGGGHAKVLIGLIGLLDQYAIEGILDPHLVAGTRVLGVRVLGQDTMIAALYKKGIKNVCIGMAGVGNNGKRMQLYEEVKAMGFLVPFLIHPKSIISKSVQISEGVQVMAGVIIHPNTLIEENTIVNTGAIVEHDCNVGKHVQICPGAIICGGCRVADGAFIGAGAIVIQGVKIGKDTTIGAGSVVINDVPDGATVKGVPAR